MRIEVAGRTHVGMKRSHNEDSYLLLPEEQLVCVADGMGGHASGEVASRMAVDEVGEFFRRTGRDADATWPFKLERSRPYGEGRLESGIKLANARIFERAAAEPRYRGMGTTVAALHFDDGAAYVGHVGDSRVYRLREGALEQLTEDHSLLNDYLKARRLTPEEVEAFPHKNVIVRALGMKESVVVDVRRLEPRDGDVYLLCSDGLSGLVSDAALREVLLATPALEAACDALVEHANAAGGTDNVTCLLVRCLA